eukprot:3705248-Pleurochrysis_carterae.AAC.1
MTLAKRFANVPDESARPGSTSCNQSQCACDTGKAVFKRPEPVPARAATNPWIYDMIVVATRLYL